MSVQKKISEEFKVEIKEHFTDVSASLIGFRAYSGQYCFLG